MSVAKSWWNWGPKMAKMLKTGNGSGFFHRKWQKKPISVSVFQKMTNFLGISTGSSSISAGSQLFLQIFQGFTRLVAKSWWKWGPKMAKLLKKEETEVDFSKFSKASRALWQKVAKFGHRKRKWGPKLLKNHVFWKKRALFHKKFEIYKIFHPQTGNARLLLRFYVTIFSNFKQNKQNFSRLHALCGKKLRTFATGNGNGVQKWQKLNFAKKLVESETEADFLNFFLKSS